MIFPAALLLALQIQALPYADSATAALIARARERHRQQDAAVHDYRALVRTRLDVSVGRGRFARLLPFAVQEQAAELEWQVPNDVKVRLLGRRQRSATSNVSINSRWTRPWFVPRFLGDSVRLLSGEDFPSQAAIHPLSPGAEAYYHYAINDSMALALPGRTVRAIGVRVTPVRADASLIAGELWLDAQTAETVRLSFVFVGRRLWVDSIGPTRSDTARADRASGLAERILRVSADLEYGLFQQRFWLPYRQAVTLDVELPWFKNLVVPVDFITTFRDVRVNQNQAILFTVEPQADTSRGRGRKRARTSAGACSSGVAIGPGSEGGLRRGAGECIMAGRMPGGRYEIVESPDSVQASYRGWSDSLRFDLSDEDVARIEDFRSDVLNTFERLPDSLTGRPRLALAFDRFTDIWRYNRAEGASLGSGYEWRLGAPFLAVMAKARYAFTDRRLQGSVALRRDAPGSRLELVAFREMRDADPLASGLSFSNSATALWFARDDGDYVFVQGGELRYQRPLGRGADLTLQARFAEESAPLRLAHDGLNDLLGGSGVFPVNGPVTAGRYAVASAELAGGGTPVGWRAGVEGTAGALAQGRGWIAATARTPRFWGLDLTASGWAGVGAGDSIPQRDFRLGGAKTLRGYPAGAFRGASAWALSLDLGLSGKAVSPVVFADAGQVAPRLARFSGRPAASVGAGLSFLGGALRLDGARPIAPNGKWRLTLTLGARR